MSMGVRQHCKSSPSPPPPLLAPPPALTPTQYHGRQSVWPRMLLITHHYSETAGGGGGGGGEHGPINPQPSHAQSSTRTVPVVKMKGGRCVCIEVLNTKWKAAGLETNTAPGRRASTQAYTCTMNSKPACSSRSPVTGFQGPSSVHHTHWPFNFQCPALNHKQIRTKH